MHRTDPTPLVSVRRVAAGLGLSTLLLAGCASAPFTVAGCDDADWFAQGVEDGVRGLAMGELNVHRDGCAADSAGPDVQAYQQGRYDGLQQYCTVANGLAAGEAGESYTGVCPAALEYYFVTGYRLGREIHGLRASMDANRERVVRAQAAELADAAAQADALRALDRDFARMQARLEYLESEGQRVTVSVPVNVAFSGD